MDFKALKSCLDEQSVWYPLLAHSVLTNVFFINLLLKFVLLCVTEVRIRTTTITTATTKIVFHVLLKTKGDWSGLGRTCVHLGHMFLLESHQTLVSMIFLYLSFFKKPKYVLFDIISLHFITHRKLKIYSYMEQNWASLAHVYHLFLSPLETRSCYMDLWSACLSLG